MDPRLQGPAAQPVNGQPENHRLRPCLPYPWPLHRKHPPSPSIHRRRQKDLGATIRISYVWQERPRPSDELTVNARLISLPAHLARQIPQPQFLVQLDHNRVLVVTEQTREGRRQWLPLDSMLAEASLRARRNHLLRALRLAAGLLSLALWRYQMRLEFLALQCAYHV